MNRIDGLKKICLAKILAKTYVAIKSYGLFSKRPHYAAAKYMLNFKSTFRPLNFIQILKPWYSTSQNKPIQNGRETKRKQRENEEEAKKES